MQKINLIIILILASLITTLSGCSTGTKAQDVDPMNLSQLESIREPSTPTTFSTAGLNAMRVKVLEDTGMGIAAQGGLAWASERINARLIKDKWNLETIYNFNGMMLSHGVLPPVLVQGDNSLNLNDPNTIRVADRTYKIVQQARFATTPPNWRDYLWMSYPKPEVPHKFLLPRDKEESRIWTKAVRKGWDKGIQQAFNIFQQNLARLRRDYKGMILYRKLLEEKMISAPYVSRTELGVTGDGNDMRVNDQVLRITELPKLQTESERWKPIVVKLNDN